MSTLKTKRDLDAARAALAKAKAAAKTIEQRLYPRGRSGRGPVAIAAGEAQEQLAKLRATVAKAETVVAALGDDARDPARTAFVAKATAAGADPATAARLAGARPLRRRN